MSRKYRVEQKFTTGWGLVSETSFKLSKDEEIGRASCRERV